MTPHEIIQLQISELDAALKESHPTMPQILRTIHTNLRQDSELVTLLTPAEVALIVQGLSIQTKTTITTSAPKRASNKLTGKALEDSLDLGL